MEIFPSCLLQGANNLKCITIHYCHYFTKLMLEGMVESLKSLQTLEIVDCQQLVSLPDGMQCLTSLEELNIRICPELINRCLRENGEDWHKISHVRNIYLDGIKI